MQVAANGFVLRRRMTGTVIGGAYHDALGAVFWERFEAASGVIHFGLTCDVDLAHRFQVDSEDHHEAFLSNILECNFALASKSDFVRLGAYAGVSVSAFAQLVAAAVWLEVVAEPAPVFLRSLDGYIDRSSKSTREPSSTHQFSPSTILRNDGLRPIHLHGCLVPVSSERLTSLAQPGTRTIRWVDHSFEAHACWSLWTLSLRFGFADVAARRQALKHAAMAGWETASQPCRVHERRFSDRFELRRLGPRLSSRGRFLLGNHWRKYKWQ